jgi:hypothetical protein
MNWDDSFAYFIGLISVSITFGTHYASAFVGWSIFGFGLIIVGLIGLAKGSGKE